MSELSLTKVYNPNPGWYRGDFHAHTNSSDGKYDPPEVVALTRQRGLDFFSITEHNNINSFSRFGDEPGMLVIPGIEVTLDTGHWNVFGMQGSAETGRQDWMEGICGDRLSISLPEDRTTTDVMQSIAARGQFNSINHPFLKPWEWQDLATRLRYVHFLEIWNDQLWPSNAQATPWAVTFWTACLNAGWRLTAIGGSDFHFLPGDHPEWPGEYMGAPTTWVYADELSGRAVLAGVQARRAYVSLGPQIDFEARLPGAVHSIGADLGLQDGEVELVASVMDGGEVQAAAVRLVHNGETAATAPLAGGEAGLSLRFPLAPERADWFRVDVFGPDGELLAITNPIFSGPQARNEDARFGDYVLDVWA